MTWVVAANSPLGAAFVISDTRVTLADGSSADLIQKSFCIAPNMVGGFSGSVRIGFELLSHLAWRLGGVDAEKIWHPQDVVKLWQPEATKLFNDHTSEERALGCSLLIGGVTALQNFPGAKSHIFRLKAPEFRPVRARLGFAAHQIGSGSTVSPYKTLIRDFFRSPASFARYGKLGNRGMASTLAMMMSREAQMAPEPSVGPFMHLVSVGNEGPHQALGVSQEPGAEAKFPTIATSYHEFCKLVAEREANASCAIA